MKNQRVYAAIVIGLLMTFPVIAQEDFEPYAVEIPGSSATIEMVPIPGGTFLMGSPDSDPEKEADEGPQKEVTVDGFWMSKYEITWDVFELFMEENKLDLEAFRASLSEETYEAVDAIGKPSPPYEDPTFGMGKTSYPAISMTQYSALSFCKWISTITGEFYRLPTEAEWEYACKAGSNTPYYSGEDVASLEEAGWYFENSEYTYHKVGEKKPNAFGLYDMMGNVSEWTLDQYTEDYYSAIEEKGLENPWIAPTALYPRTVRGGSYIDDPDLLRCSSRLESNDKRWKERDPQIPKSYWWNTDSPFLGLRLVRPKKEMNSEEIANFWSRSLDQ